MVEKKEQPRVITKKAKILASVIKEPGISQLERSNKLNISQGTVNKYMQSMDIDGKRLAKDIIDQIVANDRDVVDIFTGLAKKLVEDFAKDIENQKGKFNADDWRKMGFLNQIAKDSALRYTILKGNRTDDEGGLVLTPEESKILNITQNIIVEEKTDS